MLENIVQPAMVAGKFYEANPERLRQNLKSMAAKADLAAENIVQAVIVPHAGYVFSGLTAMKTMAQARNGAYRRALLLAPSHSVAFHSIALPAYSAFQTPLGRVGVDAEGLTRLQRLNSPLFRVNGQAHYQEHAIEVELPMWQFFFGDRPVMPLIAGQLTFREVRQAAEILTEFLTPDTLWIISSDFTHYGSSFDYLPFTTNVAAQLHDLDGQAIRHILDLDLDGFEHYLERTGATICGAVGIELLLAVLAKHPGKFQPRLIEYANSGQLTNDWSHCVSYAGLTVEYQAEKK